MYIIDVIPLIKIPLPSSQILTYFSKERVNKGALVLIPISGRKEKAIVLNSSRIEERKLEIKRRAFKLKKIEKIFSPTPLISEPQMELAFWMHKFYLTSLGPILKLFLPKTFIKRKKPMKILEVKPQISKTKTQKPLLSWGKDRMKFYLKEVEKALKKKKQVLFLLPEIQDIENFVTPIKEVAFWHGGLKTSAELKEWEKIRSGKAKLIIGMRSGVFAPFQNLGLIILEKEENPAFKSWRQHPRYDAKEVALKLAEMTKAKIILGSALPSVVSYYKAKTGKYKLISPKTIQSYSRKIKIVDMREEIRKGNYSIFSEDLEYELKKVLKEKKRAILFCNRRGMATYIFCQDCGWIAKCENCNVPMVYHKNLKIKDEKLKEGLICHHCGARRDPHIVCPNCKGHRLKYSGIGTQKVVQELKRLTPKIRIFRLDSDITPRTEAQKKIFEEFLKSKNSVLVGTQIFLKFSDLLKKPLVLVGITSSDQFLNLPEFKATEVAFQTLYKLEIFGKKLIIQTYNPKTPCLQFFRERNVEAFFEKEIQARKEFSYPPFSEIIKLSFAHKNLQKVEKQARDFKEKLEKLGATHPSLLTTQILGPIPGSIPKVKGKYIQNIILKVKNEKPEVKDLILENIPKNCEVDVNPQSLL